MEPTFGQMKVRQHARAIRLRVPAGTMGKWSLRALCHNLRKLASSRVRP